MNNHVPDSLDCLKRTVDQMLSALGQNLNLYVIRNHASHLPAFAENHTQSEMLPGNRSQSA